MTNNVIELDTDGTVGHLLGGATTAEDLRDMRDNDGEVGEML